MQNSSQTENNSIKARSRMMIRWSIILLSVFGASYLFFTFQVSMWVFPVHHTLEEEKTVFERRQKAEESYKHSSQTVDALQRNIELQRANYEISSAILEKLDLIDHSQTALRQELAESFKGVSFALGAIFLVLLASLVERLTSFLKGHKE